MAQTRFSLGMFHGFRSWKQRATVALLGALMLGGASVEARARHPLSIDDIMSVEDYGRAIFAPDGEGAIFESSSAIAESAMHAHRLSRLRAHIFRVGEGGRREPLFPQRRDVGYNIGPMSPDGAFLIIQIYDGGRNTLAVFDFRNRRLRLLNLGQNCCASQPVWITDSEFLVPVFARRDSLGQMATNEWPWATIQRANELWQRRLAGHEPSVTTLESRSAGAIRPPADPDARLMTIAAQTGQVRMIGRGTFTDLLLSPDGSKVVALRFLGWRQPLPGPETADGQPSPWGVFELWALDISSHSWTRISGEGREVIKNSLSWTQQGALVYREVATGGPTNSSEERIVALARAASGQSAVVQPQPLPSPTAILLASRARDGAAIYRDDDQQSTRLILSRNGMPPIILDSINQGFSEVEWPIEGRVEFLAPNGGTVSSCLLLPSDYRPGQRLPLIVWLYPNRRRNGSCDASEPTLRSFMGVGPSIANMLVYPTAGYAVMFVPTRSKGPNDPFPDQPTPATEIAATAEAAADAAVRQGIADQDNLFLWGFSQGNYEVLQAVTASNRFRAAFAGWGISDPASLYGQESPGIRLAAGPPVSMRGRIETPRVAIPMGGPPWQRFEEYRSASPYLNADRIRTPLLIAHSDFDEFPLEQSSQIFSALYEQRRDARYLIYWGENHGPSSPANLRNLWQEILGWFERYRVRH